MTHDEFYMQKTLSLANLGRGFVSPNPMVGSIIVKNGRIIGEGYHQRYGESHAEVMAIQSAKDSVEGATLYSNLEPCCHLRKKTPPCTELIIKSKIKKVVVANIDPNPEVAGKGLKRLEEMGITTIKGILAKEGAKLNEHFFTFMSKNRPFIHVKLAQTLDGQMATQTGHSQWITSEQLRQEAHRLRSGHSAIAVGSGTVKKDNPALTVRYNIPHREMPLRVVIGSLHHFTFNEQLFTDAFRDRTVLFAPEKEVVDLKINIQDVVATPSISGGNQLDLNFILKNLAQRGITSLLIEGGPTLITSFFKQKLVDRLTCFIAPKIIGSGMSMLHDLAIFEMGQAIHFTDHELSILDNHFCFSGCPKFLR